MSNFYSFSEQLEFLGAERFDINRGMLKLENVANFSEILIHIGNTHKDTSGCILLGESSKLQNSRIKLISSAKAYKIFYNLVIEYALKDNLELGIVDDDIDLNNKEKRKND